MQNESRPTICDIGTFTHELLHCRAEGNKLHVGDRTVTFESEDAAIFAEGLEAAMFRMKRMLEAQHNG